MAYQYDKIREHKFILPENTDVSLLGALCSGCDVRAELRIPKNASTESAFMHIHSDGYEGEIRKLELPLEKSTDMAEYDSFSVTFNTRWLSEQLVSCPYGLFYYEYTVNLAAGTLHLGGEKPTELTDAWENGERQLLIYAENIAASEKLKDGIIYHIFVDRFRNSGKCPVKRGAVLDPDWHHGIPQFGEYPGADVKNNVFFGGDLYGIIEKLPYIASLGASTVYLSPVFDAASNHKYDTGDYLTVDEMFGGDEALAMLCREAEKYGIGIMLDGVFNHTGSDSIYFNKEGNYDSIGAYQSKQSPYYPWYSFKEYPDEYECWWGVKILPRVNSAGDDYLDFICEKVVPKWMNAGVSHWRLDVADELSDRFLDRFRESVRRCSADAQVVGEVWEDASDKVSYGRRRHYLSSGQLSSVMNYPLRSAVISYINSGDTESLRHATEGLYRRYPKHTSDTLMNFLGTHDTERALTVFGDSGYGELSNAELSVRHMDALAKERGSRKLLEAYAMICALPGIPCVFYGDEAGVEGYRDPFCRKTFPWNNMDESLVSAYAELGNFRKREKLLRDAYFEIISLTKEEFSFIRRPVDGKGYSIITVINNTDEPRCYALDRVAYDTNGNEVGESVTLPPRGWAYLKV